MYDSLQEDLLEVSTQLVEKNAKYLWGKKKALTLFLSKAI